MSRIFAPLREVLQKCKPVNEGCHKMVVISYYLQCILTVFESFVGFLLVVISVLILVKLTRNKIKKSSNAKKTT